MRAGLVWAGSLLVVLATAGLGQEPPALVAWADRAWAAHGRKDWAEAERCFYEASRYGVLREHDWTGLREAQVATGRIDEGVRDARMGLRLRPSVATAGNLCWAYNASGDFGAARALVRGILASPDRERTNYEQIIEWVGCRDELFTVTLEAAPVRR